MTKKEIFIMDFKEIRAESLPLVGGKEANPGEMAAAGYISESYW